MPFEAQTLTADSGTDGRIRSVDNGLTLAGLSMWKRTGTATIMPYPHFESGVELNGLVKPNKLRGLGDDKFNFHGWYNLDTTDGTEVVTGTNIVNGQYVNMDFLVSKETTQGYTCFGWIANLEVTVDVENKVADFTGTLDVDGVLGSFQVLGN